MKGYTIPSGVETIKESAFYSTSIEELILPSSVKRIGKDAFGGNSKLKYIDLKCSITTISEGAFGMCDNLEGVVLPKSVTSIEKKAFLWCDKMQNVFYDGTLLDWQEMDIAEGNDYINPQTRLLYSETEPINKEFYWHYDANGKAVCWDKTI